MPEKLTADEGSARDNVERITKKIWSNVRLNSDLPGSDSHEEGIFP
jgi:hypothetical protein